MLHEYVHCRSDDLPILRLLALEFDCYCAILRGENEWWVCCVKLNGSRRFECVCGAVAVA